jgi:hypothetical protein
VPQRALVSQPRRGAGNDAAIEIDYNRERPHSSLCHLTPEEFVAKNGTQTTQPSDGSRWQQDAHLLAQQLLVSRSGGPLHANGDPKSPAECCPNPVGDAFQFAWLRRQSIAVAFSVAFSQAERRVSRAIVRPF